MKGRILFATIFVGLVNFIVGVARSFLGAYVFVKPNAKFTGDGAFQLGIMISGWMSVFLMVSFLATSPIYLKAFGKRSLRHLLIYAAVFLVVVSVLFQSPPAVGLAIVVARILAALSAPGPWQVMIPPLVAVLIGALLFSGVVFVVTIPFRRRIHST